MINGESYKVIVAEAGKASTIWKTTGKATGVDQNHFERVFHCQTVCSDKDDPKEKLPEPLALV